MRKIVFVFVCAFVCPVSARAFTWPVQGKISSEFGPRGSSFHTGIDIAAPVGEPIYSVHSGTVKFAGTLSRYGKTIIIWHGSFYSLYAHCSRLFFKAKEKIQDHKVVGLVGLSGNAKGAHLHFEIRNHAFLPADPLILFDEDIFTKIPKLIENYGEENVKKYSIK